MSIEGQGHFFTIYFPGFVCFVLYKATISGECLQDHWSSCSISGANLQNKTMLYDGLDMYLPHKLVSCYHALAMRQQAKANVSLVFIGSFEKSIIQSYPV